MNPARSVAFALAVTSLLLACEKDKPKPADPEVAPKPSAEVERSSPKPTGEAAAPGATVGRPKAPQNVLLITVDALRADMPWAGYDKEIAPHLTEFAKGAVVYENHRSVSSYTAQTVATLMTGRYASTLYRTGTFFTNYFDANVWITEGMQEKSVRTMAVHAHLYFDRAPGLKQGFDVYNMVPGLTWNAQTDESVTGDKSISAIIDLLKDPQNTKGQFFLWSHLMDPHDQYVKHEGSPDFGKDNRGRYDSEVWHVDECLGRLFEFGKTQPWWDNTVIMISADHGEAFGEHGMFKHAFELWDVLARIPLLVKAPGAQPKRIKEARSHIDVAPTIVDLLGLPALEGFQGKSMAPEIYGEAPANSREPIILELAEDTNNPPRRALIEGEYKLISFEKGRRSMLFQLKNDPAEEKDLAEAEPEKLKELDEKLSKAFDALPVVAPFGGNKLRTGKIASGPKGPTVAAEAGK